MSYSGSQEQTIYRNLAGQIQLGFFDHGEPFPSAQEIARQHYVSYCPAQRALKSLEREGLVRLSRGKKTVVLKKPFDHYLESNVFKERIIALADLCKTLRLISTDIGFEGLCHMDAASVLGSFQADKDFSPQGKLLYRLFEQSLRALGSRTVLSLYYDVGSFIESAFLDIIYALHGKEEADLLLHKMTSALLQCLQHCEQKDYASAKRQLNLLGTMFYTSLEPYFSQLSIDPNCDRQEPFHWETQKGRLQYCDVIAIDLICKINQGMYPVGSLLPRGDLLADIYHVSGITIRRTLALLNKLGVVKNINGVGTRVASTTDSAILHKMKDLMMDDNLRSFLEAFQLLSITCESVVRHTFPHISQESFDAISKALDMPGNHAPLVATMSACLQAVVRCCPLVSLREIYEKITLLLLMGGVLRLDKVDETPFSEWPEFSENLRESLKEKDGARFAAAFRQLMLHNFLITKKTLLDAGVCGIEEIVTPKSFMV